MVDLRSALADFDFNAGLGVQARRKRLIVTAATLMDVVIEVYGVSAYGTELGW